MLQRSSNIRAPWYRVSHECMRSAFICLQICADTMIGNQLIRGISGGQKKRVTTGEIVLLQHTDTRGHIATAFPCIAALCCSLACIYPSLMT